jgi:hypothetical protein
MRRRSPVVGSSYLDTRSHLSFLFEVDEANCCVSIKYVHR